MDTQIRYLERLSEDLHEAALRESLARVRSLTAAAQKSERAAPPGRVRTGLPRYAKVIAAAAAFLVVAGGLGYLLPTGGGGEGAVSNFDEAPVSGDSAGGGSAGRAPAASVPGTGRLEYTKELSGSRLNAVHDSVGTPTVPAPAEESALNQTGGDPSLGEVSKIIRTARLGIVIEHDSFDARFQDASEISTNAGGFVESSQQGLRSGRMVLRVPAGRFDGVRRELKALGIKTENEVIDGQDVTAQYIDLRARLEILNERKDALLELLRDATALDTILRLTNVIDEVQFRIEEIKGRLRLLKDQTSQATISISMREEGVEPQENVENPSLASAWDKSIAGFLRVIGAVVVGLGYLIPIAVIGGIVWVAVTLVRRRQSVTATEDD